MRYFSYEEPDEYGNNVVVTVSEDYIIESYYPWWCQKMIEKYGEEYFYKNFCFQDCVDDFVTVRYGRVS